MTLGHGGKIFSKHKFAVILLVLLPLVQPSCNCKYLAALSQNSVLFICGQEATNSLSITYLTRTHPSTADQEALVANDSFNSFLALVDSMHSWRFWCFSLWCGVKPVGELLERLLAIPSARRFHSLAGHIVYNHVLGMQSRVPLLVT